MGQMKALLIRNVEKYMKENKVPYTPENWAMCSAIVSGKASEEEYLANMDDSSANEESPLD